MPCESLPHPRSSRQPAPVQALQASRKLYSSPTHDVRESFETPRRRPAPAPGTAGDIVVNMHDIEIAAVAEQISRLTGRTLILDPQVRGTVNVTSAEPLSSEGVWSLFQSVGSNSPRFNEWRRWFAAGFATIIVVGNVSFPVAVMAGIVS